MQLQSKKDLKTEAKLAQENDIIARISKTLHDAGIKMVSGNDPKVVDAQSIHLLADIASNLYRVCISDLAWLAKDDKVMKDLIQKKHKEVLNETLKRYNININLRNAARKVN